MAGSAIAVVDYGMGNLLSVTKALEALGAQVRLVRAGAELGGADALVVPGVGAFPDAMERLAAAGLDAALVEAARAGVPLLGICLGLQVLFEASDEGQGARGLGLLPGRVTRLPGGGGLKIPHMGWNSVTWESFPLFEGLEPGAYFYFVHSFAVPAGGEDGPDDGGVQVARCHYGRPFVAAAARGAVMGTQFHPEKSGRTGLRLLENFLSLTRSIAKGVAPCS